MKKYFMAIGIAAAFFLTGCETAEEKELRLARQHEREMAKINSGYYNELNQARHEERMAYYSRPVAPGAYVDYRGNIEHGYWDGLGYWRWYDDDSIYARQSRNYVSYQIATGALVAATAYSLTRDSWSSRNPRGWQQTNITVNNYTSSSGERIDSSQYNNRMETSKAKLTTARGNLSQTRSKAPPSVVKKIQAKRDEVAKRPGAKSAGFKTQSNGVAQGGWGKKNAAAEDKQWGNCTTQTCKQNKRKAQTDLAKTPPKRGKSVTGDKNGDGKLSRSEQDALKAKLKAQREERTKKKTQNNPSKRTTPPSPRRATPPKRTVTKAAPAKRPKKRT